MCYTNFTYMAFTTPST